MGITGRSGSGKSWVAAHYASQGYAVADGDALSRQVTQPGSPCLGALVQAFGPQILHADGSLDRKQLGALAFAEKEANQTLIDITHPAILDAFLQQVQAAQAAGATLFFLDGAMIVSGPTQPYCDKLVVLAVEDAVSIARIMQRDGISRQQAMQRLNAQPPQQVLCEAADYVIENNGTPADLRQKADEVLRQLLADAKGGGRPG